MRIEFPEGFLWGASTSSHQVEGGNDRNDWWRFEKQGRVPDESGLACDQYHLFEQDFDLAVELGHTAHRLSIEWSRIEPASGVFDAEEIRHYVTVLKALKDRGLTTFVTLHHFTNPVWFADEGGWTSSTAPQRFERYVRQIVEPFAPYVDFWMTVNEPTSIAINGYLFGDWPPARRWDLSAAVLMLDTMADAHNLAAAVIKEASADAQVGFANILMDWRPSNPSSRWQKALLKRIEALSNHRFCDRVRDSLDFIGVQYYHTLRIGWRPYGPGHIAGADKTDIGWDIVPSGLRSVVLDCWHRYHVPIYITENGLADARDEKRTTFIKDHLQALRTAMDDGADVRGYLHWSLLDNYEWAFGYAPRFGLVEVDYHTQKRVPRPSAFAYREIIETNGFEIAEKPVVKPSDIEMDEYRMLRDEITRHEEQIFSSFTFSLAGAAAIISWGLGQANWAVLAFTPVVLIPAGLLILSRVKMEMRIAAYLRVFFEERTADLNWESVLIDLYDVDKSPEGLLVVALFLPMVLAGGASLFAAWHYATTAAARSVIMWELVVIVAVVLITALIAVRSQRGRMHDRFISALKRRVRDAKS